MYTERELSIKIERDCALDEWSAQVLKIRQLKNELEQAEHNLNICETRLLLARELANKNNL